MTFKLLSFFLAAERKPNNGFEINAIEIHWVENIILFTLFYTFNYFTHFIHLLILLMLYSTHTHMCVINEMNTTYIHKYTKKLGIFN